MEPIFVKQREIWLVPFPFSDFSASKVRPVLVVSNNQFNEISEDAIVCGITSNINKRNDYMLKIDNNSLQEGHLLSVCSVKAENILKIDKRLLIKKIGQIKKEVFEEIAVKLNLIFSLS